MDRFDKTALYGDAMRFIVAIGVLCWLHAMALIIIYIIRPRIDQHLAYLPIYELALYVQCVRITS